MTVDSASISSRAKQAVRSLLPTSAVAAIRRQVLHRKPVLHSLETHLTDHCNLNCKGCGHFSSISPRHFADPVAFDRDMRQLATQLSNIDVFSLLGGEPLLHDAVLDFAKSARSAFPDAQVHLVTNGLLVPRMPDEFWSTLREQHVRLNISSYPIERNDDYIRERAESERVELWYSPPRSEFYAIPLREEGDSSPAASFVRCRTLGNCPFLQDGHIYPCGYAALAHIAENRFDMKLPPSPEDSIDLYSGIDGIDIMEFLARPIPFCRFCDMDRLRYFEWARTERARDEWT